MRFRDKNIVTSTTELSYDRYLGAGEGMYTEGKVHGRMNVHDIDYVLSNNSNDEI